VQPKRLRLSKMVGEHRIGELHDFIAVPLAVEEIFFPRHYQRPVGPAEGIVHQQACVLAVKWFSNDWCDIESGACDYRQCPCIGAPYGQASNCSTATECAVPQLIHDFAPWHFCKAIQVSAHQTPMATQGIVIGQEDWQYVTRVLRVDAEFN